MLSPKIRAKRVGVIKDKIGILKIQIFCFLHVEYKEPHYMLRIKGGMKKGGGLGSENCFFWGTQISLAYA